MRNRELKEHPMLQSQRLHLDALQWTDIPKMVEYVGDKDIAKTTTNIPHPYYPSDAIWFLNNVQTGFTDGTEYVFAIRKKNNNEYIGNIGLHIEPRFDIAEMGYWIAKPFWRNGYATEAAGALLKFGFESLNLNKIYATHFKENIASGNVMIKNGMIQEGILISHIKKGNMYIDLVQYRLLRAEYLARNT